MSAVATRGSYPHPVLDVSDDVDSTFEILNVAVTPTVEDVELKFQVRMTDPDIQALLDDGRARYSARWACSSTIATGVLDLTDPTHLADGLRFVTWIDQQDVRRNVRVEVKIIASAPIRDYRLTRQHADYGNATFDLLPGDVIADGGYFDFEPDKLYDPLAPPIGSCFRFVADRTLRRGLAVRFHDDEHVLVAFPEKVLPGLAAMANRPELQISLVVLPALMQTIAFIKENLDPVSGGEDLTDKTWYRAVRDLVEGVGSFDDPAFELAQKILGNTLAGALLATLEMVEEE